MLFKIIKALTFILYLIICIGCNKGWQYIEKSSDYVSFGIDYHDIEKIVDSNAQSLLSSDYVNKLKENKILVISDIINQTQDDIDIEVLSRKLMRKIAQSHKFTLSNVVGGEDIRIDTMIYDSRNFNNNEYFNQYTTQEKGTLVAPELSLSGKFISRLKYIGNIIRMDYIFLLTLTDLKTGKVVWDNEEIISKAIDKQHAKDFLESKKTRNVTFNTKDDSNTADNTYSQQESIENTETIEEQLKKIKQLCPKVYIYDEYNKNNQTCDDLVENFIQNAIKHSMQEYIDNLVNSDIVLDVINQIISINNINQSLFIQKRDDLITEIKSIKDNPQSEVKNLLAKTLYQDALDIEEMINVLTNIRIDDLTQALEKIINTKIFLQINYLADKKEVNDFTTTSLANKFDYQPLNQDIKDLVVDDNNMQANIMLSYKINTKLSREEKILFNALFGSGADSLLFKIIREQHHLCYSVSSMLMENDILAVYVGLDKDKIDFCIKEVNNILEQLKENDSIYNLDSIIKQVEDKLLRSRDKFSYNKQLIINHVLFGYEYDINTIINNISNMTSDKIKDIANVITPINQVIIK